MTLVHDLQQQRHLEALAHSAFPAKLNMCILVEPSVDQSDVGSEFLTTWVSTV